MDAKRTLHVERNSNVGDVSCLERSFVIVVLQDRSPVPMKDNGSVLVRFTAI